MDVGDVDLNLLKAFNALMAERHVTRAAQRLGISQPAMSAALARLRRLTGDELLVRGSRGLAPTPRAIDLEQPIHHALQQIADALGAPQGFDPTRARQAFGVAMADLPAQMLAPALAAHLMHAAPMADLRLRSFRDRRDTIRLLDEGQVDAAIGVSPGNEVRILHRALFEQAFVGVAAIDAPGVDRLAGLDGFCSAKHLLVSPEGDDFGAIDAALEKVGRSRRIAASIAAMHLAPEIVAGSSLVAALPEDVVSASPFRDRLVTFSLPIPVDPVTFHLFWHRRTDDHPAQRWLRDAITEIASEKSVRSA